MAFPNDVANTRLTAYKIKWGSDFLGLADDVDPSGIEMNLKPVKVGTFGDVELGDRIISVGGVIKVEFREIILDLYKKLTPWWSSGSIRGNPATRVDLYSYTKVLNLHPTDKADNDLTEDLNFLKAVPITPPGLIKRDGVNDEKNIIEFKIYPDRATLPVLDFYYVGAPPA